jgi:hypothetical protein
VLGCWLLLLRWLLRLLRRLRVGRASGHRHC